MTGCLNESMLQAWLDGELSPEASAAARSHLAGCAACSARARDAEKTLALVDDAWRSELSPLVPAARLRARVEEGLTARPARVDRLWWRTGFADWRIGAAIAVLVMAVAGAVTIPLPQNPPARPVSRQPAVPEPTRVETETSRHLGQTQLLLRSIRNAEDETVRDVAYERELSRELLMRNRLLRRSAERRNAARAEAVLSEIEPLLLDIANLPEQPALEEMRSLKELIHDQQIIAELQVYAGKNLF
jgi:hypothetical protein